MSFVINPYRFGGGAPPGGTLPTPLHWFDLNDDGVWADDGDATTPITLTESGGVQVNATGGANGQAVASMSAGTHLTGGSPAWQGTQVGGEDHISFASWYYITSYDTNGTMVLSWRGGGDFICQINNDTATEQVRCFVSDDTPDLVTANGANNTADEGVWIHIAVTWDGTTLTVYKDGAATPIATGTNASTGDLIRTGVPFDIGHLDSDLAFDMFGRIGATGIWDNVLTAAEVSTLYGGGTSGDGYYADFTWT